MAEQKSDTFFIVDQEACIGCGICVSACPMKILAVVEGLCTITDQAKCLLCETCARDCPEKAIVIDKEKGMTFMAAHRDTPIQGRTTDVGFTPILAELKGMLEEISPVQVFDFEGTDIRALDNFILEGRQCYTRCYAADKLEKIGISSINFFGSMTADVLCITPGKAYDLPYFVMDWDESEEHIFFICDLMPCDDPGRSPTCLNNYLYEPLEDLYQTYSLIPGLRNSVFHWVRAVHSPYIITGTIDKASPQNVDGIHNCALDYLKAWMKLYRNAKPCDPDSDYMKLIQARKKNIRALYRENDPGVGSLNKFLGDKLADISLSIIEP